MARKSRKPCNYYSCPNLAIDKENYCTDHIHIKEQMIKKQNKFYDKNIRDKKLTEFYHSKEWERARDFIIKKYKGLDLFAYYIENKIVSATTAHHIVEVREDWDKRLLIINLFPTSESNHNKIHGMYKKDKKGTQKLLRELLEKWNKEYDMDKGRGSTEIS